jgi:predicted metalloenzyme YecM
MNEVNTQRFIAKALSKLIEGCVPEIENVKINGRTVAVIVLPERLWVGSELVDVNKPLPESKEPPKPYTQLPVEIDHEWGQHVEIVRVE